MTPADAIASFQRYLTGTISPFGAMVSVRNGAELLYVSGVQVLAAYPRREAPGEWFYEVVLGVGSSDPGRVLSAFISDPYEERYPGVFFFPALDDQGEQRADVWIVLRTRLTPDEMARYVRGETR